jgi:predicted ATPase with chaperone activity
MKQRLGMRVVKKGLISISDLRQARERQRMFGGRIGSNLVALDLLSEEDLATFFRFFPKQPSTAKETKIDISFISDLILKHALFLKSFDIKELTEKLMLNQSVMIECLDSLRHDRMIEITRGDTSLLRSNYQYRITDSGINRALNLMEENRYVGPVPVSLDDYRYATEIQTIRSVEVKQERVEKAFSDVVVSESKLRSLGAAINSGKPIFLYGPPGNGKTTIAETIGKSLPGDIYVPYSVMVGSQIIIIYDQVNHRAVDYQSDSKDYDRRWIKVRRPVVISGGELTLKALDLDFNSDAKYYEAPLQMKANNGLFIIDDFGRQLADPETLLNRWIVPLDRQVDFLTLHTGMKFEIPFDQFVIFATNISPKKLADEAF